MIQIKFIKYLYYFLFLLLLRIINQNNIVENIKKEELSILIPTYNFGCSRLVECIKKQVDYIKESLLKSFRYEIIVAEDGSSNIDTINENSTIERYENCKHIIYDINEGRAVIRNKLTRISKFKWILFIDSDMSIDNDSFLLSYLCSSFDTVIDGGVKIKGNMTFLRNNLRFIYEKSAEHSHTAQMRKKIPYHHFHTANFMILRKIMIMFPFDERFKNYGYEDVLLGKTLYRNGIKIFHINNTVSFDIFENNEHFVQKTEEGLNTLYSFREELCGYSKLLDIAKKIEKVGLKNTFVLIHKALANVERKNITGNRPSLFIFKLYKIGFYLSIK